MRTLTLDTTSWVIFDDERRRLTVEQARDLWREGAAVSRCRAFQWLVWLNFDLEWVKRVYRGWR